LGRNSDILPGDSDMTETVNAPFRRLFGVLGMKCLDRLPVDAEGDGRVIDTAVYFFFEILVIAPGVADVGADRFS
jgi:hypothetical protein